jgi:hypothetical protein
MHRRKISRHNSGHFINANSAKKIIQCVNFPVLDAIFLLMQKRHNFAIITTLKRTYKNDIGV